MWLIRLAISTYELQEVLRVGKAVSETVVAMQGTTGGSGLATTETRLALIQIVDRAVAYCPATAFTLVVDDLGIDLTGGPRWVEKQMVAVVSLVCDAITAVEMEASKSKSVVSASCSDLGHGFAW